MPKKAQIHVHVVSHTHWDREWYFPFHRFRVYLNRTLKQVLDLLEQNPDYRHFVLDGQAVILEDYVEIFPEEKDRLRRQVQAGRLSIGPWYILPDEFLVSGEATVRNLLMGDAVCRAFGGRQTVGYMPDSFGHLAQMPQILRKAGLDSFIFTRGHGEELETLGTEYWWRAPDGSTVLTVNQRTGYWNFAALGYRELWENNTRRRPDFSLAQARTEALLTEYAGLANVNVFLFNNGVDHMLPQPELPAWLARLRLAFPHVTFQHSSFEAFIRAVKNAKPRLRTYQGELLSGKYHFILSGVWSARMYLKQLNDRAQTLLEKVTEPLAVYAWLTGGVDYPQETLDYAWKRLLQNHPHDSICGCSTDEVHREMVPRFEGVLQTAEQLVRDRLEALSPYIGAGEEDERQPTLVLFNPLTFARTEVVERLLILPPGLDIRELELLDPKGRRVPFEVVWAEEAERFWNVDLPTEIYPEPQRELYDLYYVQSFPQQRTKRRKAPEITNCFAWIRFVARDVPALSHQVYRLQKRGPARKAATVQPRVSATRNRLENEFCRVTVHRNGTVDLLHKPSGVLYQGLNLLADTEDVGDEYDYAPARHSQTVTSRVCRGTVEPAEATGLCARLRVRFDFPLPRRILSHRRRRSRRRVACPVQVEVTLRAGSPLVEFVTTVENRAEDHRLRVHFPAPFRTDRIYSDGAFLINARSTEVPRVEDWAQAPLPTRPQQDFSFLHDGRHGLAVFNRGLPEVEAIPTRTGTTLALTLLRCVGWLSRADGLRNGDAGPRIATPEAQCPGRHVFHYAVAAFRGDPIDAGLKRLADAYKSPLLLKQGQRSHTLWKGRSLLSVASPRVAVSAVKKHRSRNSVILRLYNLTGKPVRETVRSEVRVKRAWYTDLLEKRLERIELRDPHGVPVRLGAHEIVTLEIAF